MFVANTPTAFSSLNGGHTGAATDRALDLGKAANGGATVTDSPFLNAANLTAASDTLSVSFWQKLYSINGGGSASVWINAPSVGRDLNAHLPWSNDNLYYDTAGCCNPPQRISAGIGTFPPYSSLGIGDGWWTNWHQFVYVKSGINKQIYIDGQLFLDQSAAGVNAAPLATDINYMDIGYGAGSVLGLIDDFAVFGDPLSQAQVTQLATGTSPSSVSGVTNLIAYWSFDDVGPAFISSRSPAPNATGLPSFGPAAVPVVAVLYDGSTKVATNTVRLTFNGTDVTSQSAITVTTPGVTQVYYKYPPLTSGSTNRVTLVFSDNATPANVVSNSWVFYGEVWTGTTRDVLHGYVGLIQSAAKFTANGGGHSGAQGDYAIDMTNTGGPIHIDDATFLYPAETNNTMSFSFWLKEYNIGNSAFWVNSPSSGGSRGFQAHVPWSDGTIYFDTSGCCSGTDQRISAPISSFVNYVDAGFWTNWHHFVFLYDAGDKQIWIDGLQFLDGNSASPLALDFTDMWLGNGPGGSPLKGLMDDFAAYATPLTPANIALLAQGTSPTALAGEKILAYWNFNDVPATATISIARNNSNLVITYSGTLLSAPSVTGPYTAVSGASSPYTVSPTGSKAFYRASQ